MAKAYCDNKDLFMRSMDNTPHIQIIDSTISIGGARNGITQNEATVSYQIQNNAGVEVWQKAAATEAQGADKNNNEDDNFKDNSYDEAAVKFLQRVKEIAADIRTRAPHTLFVEWDVNPFSAPLPQAQMLETFRPNGYTTLPGHDSHIVAGSLTTLESSLLKQQIERKQKNSSDQQQQQLPPIDYNKDRLDIHRLSTKEHGVDFGTMVHTSYGMPPVWDQQVIDCAVVWALRDSNSDVYRHYVGYIRSDDDDDENEIEIENGQEPKRQTPVCCMTLCLGAGIVGIHAAGTHPNYQKQGFFQELLYLVVRDHLPATIKKMYPKYAASARSTSAALFQKHGAVTVASKFKFLV